MINVAPGKTATQARSRRSRISAGGVPAGREIPVDRREAQPQARQLDALVNELKGEDFAAMQRLEILRYLDQFGPRLVREIPHMWPITRQHIRSLVKRLVEDGLLAFAGNGANGTPRQLGLTEAGSRVLEEIDWSETIRLADEETTGAEPLATSDSYWAY